MRVNVYNEELTGRVEPTAKRANGQIFLGIRFPVCFKSEGGEKQKIRHGGDDDDDTPAVTFFFQDDKYWKPLLRKSLQEALDLLDHPERFNDAIAALDE